MKISCKKVIEIVDWKFDDMLIYDWNSRKFKICNEKYIYCDFQQNKVWFSRSQNNIYQNFCKVIKKIEKFCWFDNIEINRDMNELFSSTDFHFFQIVTSFKDLHFSNLHFSRFSNLSNLFAFLNLNCICFFFLIRKWWHLNLRR